MILSQDIISQHSVVSSTFSGTNFTSLLSASVDMPSPFSGLTPYRKLIATKSRRLRHDDKRFVQSEIDKML